MNKFFNFPNNIINSIIISNLFLHIGDRLHFREAQNYTNNQKGGEQTALH